MSSVPGEDSAPGDDGIDGWSTVEVDGDGNITAKVDSDLGQGLMTSGKNGKTR